MRTFIVRSMFAALVAVGVLLLSASSDGSSSAVRAQEGMRLVIDRRANLGDTNLLSNFIAVQGTPWNAEDPFEARAWSSLRMRTDGAQLLNDESYWPFGGIQVLRATEPPGAQCPGGARGPLGPKSDLWICVNEFEAYLRNWQATLGTDLNQTLGLGVMPRTLSYNPDSPNWMLMSPREPEEWSAVMREVGRYLAEIGWHQPLIFFFGEYENFFYGKDRPLYDGTFETAQARAEDYAELYMLTQNALQEHLPEVKLAGAVTSTYSREHTRDLQQNPYALGLEDWLEALRLLDSTFEPSAVGWQGYYWYGLDGYGDGRLLEGAESVRRALHDLGFREDIPQYLDGWNGTWGNPEVADGSMTDEARVMKEAAHLTSSVIDWLEIGSATRRIESAFYYTWNLDAPPTPDYHCIFPYQSVVSTRHDEMDLGDPDGCNIPASEIECKRATYHALKFLNDLRGGNFVAANFGGADPARPALRVAAAKKRNATEIVAAHRDGAAISLFNLVVKGLAPRTRYTVTVNTVQPGDDACATVASRVQRVRSDRHGTLTLPLTGTENGLVQIRVQPR